MARGFRAPSEGMETGQRYGSPGRDADNAAGPAVAEQPGRGEVDAFIRDGNDDGINGPATASSKPAQADEPGFKMTAVDQRPPIKNPVAKARGTDTAPWEDVAGVKALLIEERWTLSSAMLLDRTTPSRAASPCSRPRRG